MALEATDRRDTQASIAAVERARRVPVRAQEELGLGDVPTVIPEREGARAEAVTAVPAEGGAGDRARECRLRSAGACAGRRARGRWYEGR